MILINLPTRPSNLKLTSQILTNQISKKNKTARLCEKQGYLLPPIN